MKPTTLASLAAGVALSLSAGCALAQDASSVMPAGQPAVGADGYAAPNAGAAASNTSGVASDPNAGPAQVTTLRQGDNTLVTNGPVPDTRANRAKYGRPMSNAGKKTRPTGN